MNPDSFYGLAKYLQTTIIACAIVVLLNILTLSAAWYTGVWSVAGLIATGFQLNFGMMILVRSFQMRIQIDKWRTQYLEKIGD